VFVTGLGPRLTARPVEEVFVPTKFGRFELLERISVGGMAEVFKGCVSGAAGFEKILAIKRILPQLTDDDQFVSMFIQEAKISANLNHPNIGQVFEFGEADGQYFLAMEYIHGKDLRTIQQHFRQQRTGMPVPMALRIISEVCSALDYAHSKRDTSGQLLRILHRDISPQNVLISYEGAVKLIDFGIAKALALNPKTATGLLKGKLSYMSPELVDGSAPVDARSDLFALGTVLYELVTGERLFYDRSDMAILLKVRNAEVQPPSFVNPDVPSGLDPIVLKALARDPADRYQRAEELYEALDHFAQQEGLTFSGKQLSRWMVSTFAPELESSPVKAAAAGAVQFVKMEPEPALDERPKVPSALEPEPALESRFEQQLDVAVDKRTMVSVESAKLASKLKPEPLTVERSLLEEEGATRRALLAASPRVSDDEPPTSGGGRAVDRKAMRWDVEGGGDERQRTPTGQRQREAAREHTPTGQRQREAARDRTPTGQRQREAERTPTGQRQREAAPEPQRRETPREVVREAARDRTPTGQRQRAAAREPTPTEQRQSLRAPPTNADEDLVPRQAGRASTGEHARPRSRAGAHSRARAVMAPPGIQNDKASRASESWEDVTADLQSAPPSVASVPPPVDLQQDEQLQAAEEEIGPQWPTGRHQITSDIWKEPTLTGDEASTQSAPPQVQRRPDLLAMTRPYASPSSERVADKTERMPAFDPEPEQPDREQEREVIVPPSELADADQFDDLATAVAPDTAGFNTVLDPSLSVPNHAAASQPAATPAASSTSEPRHPRISEEAPLWDDSPTVIDSSGQALGQLLAEQQDVLVDAKPAPISDEEQPLRSERSDVDLQPPPPRSRRSPWLLPLLILGLVMLAGGAGAAAYYFLVYMKQ
jgi:serine/threonine protein kinase